MAKNYTLGEGFAALKAGDPAARADIARRFPLFATASAEEIVSSVTMLTARQVEKQLRTLHAAKLEGFEAEVEADEDEEPAPKKAKKEKAEKPAKKAAPVEDDEDEDDEDEEPAPKKVKKEKPAKKAKKAAPVEDDDDDEDDEPKPKKKKAKDDDDFDPNDFFEDDEDE